MRNSPLYRFFPVTAAMLICITLPALHAQAPPAGKGGVVVDKQPAVENKAPVKPAAESKKAADPDGKRLENEKKRLEHIEKSLRYGIQKDRKDAINSMLSLKSGEAKDKAAALLVTAIREESDSEVRARAITVAGDMKVSAAAPEIRRALEEDSPEVCIAAVNALRNLKDGGSRDLMSAKLQKQDLSKDSNLVESLLNALGEFNAAELSGFAEGKITDTSTSRFNRELLVLFLGKVKAAGSKEFLLKILKDENEDRELRGFAANALGAMGAKDAAGDINGVIKQIDAYPFKKKKEYYNLQMYCVAALAKLGDESAFPRLMDALKSDSAVIRLKAIKLLREMKDKRTIDILKYKRDYDPSTSVQKAARSALVEMGVDDGSKDSPPSSDETPAEERGIK